MSSTRSFNSLGVVAKNATPVTNDSDPDRVTGTAYRKTDVTTFQQQEGELYNVPPSTEFINQKLNNQSSFTDVMNRHGLVGWSNNVDYVPAAIVWASDKKFYTCKASNGPSTKIVDPISDNQGNPIYWIVLDNAGLLREQLAVEDAPNEGDRRVGYTGMTVQKALDNAFQRVGALGTFKVLFSINLYLFPHQIDYPYMYYTQAHNIGAINVIKEEPDDDGQMHGFEIVFENELDDINYMSLINTTWNINFPIHSAVTAYMYDKTVGGLKCGYNFVDPRLSHRKGFNYKDYLYGGDPNSIFPPTRAEAYYTCLMGFIIT
jgi:hypothetical protein